MIAGKPNNLPLHIHTRTSSKGWNIILVHIKFVTVSRLLPKMKIATKNESCMYRSCKLVNLNLALHFTSAHDGIWN